MALLCLTVEGPGGGAVLQRATRVRPSVECRCWFSHLGFCWNSPTHILPSPPSLSLSYLHQENLPTKPSRLQSKWPHLPATHQSQSLSPARAELPQAWVPWVLALRTPRLAAIGLTCLGCRMPSCACTQGLGRRRGGVRRSLISPLPGFLWGRQMNLQPLTPPPPWERVREEQMPGASCLRLPPYLFSRPVLASRPPPDTSPSVWGARSSQGAPTLLLLPSLMFTSIANHPFHPPLARGIPASS